MKGIIRFEGDAIHFVQPFEVKNYTKETALHWHDPENNNPEITDAEREELIKTPEYQEISFKEE